MYSKKRKIAMKLKLLGYPQYLLVIQGVFWKEKTKRYLNMLLNIEIKWVAVKYTKYFELILFSQVQSAFRTSASQKLKSWETQWSPNLYTYRKKEKQLKTVISRNRPQCREEETNALGAILCPGWNRPYISQSWIT